MTDGNASGDVFKMVLSWSMQTPGGSNLRVSYSGAVTPEDMAFLDSAMLIIKDTVLCGQCSKSQIEERGTRDEVEAAN